MINRLDIKNWFEQGKKIGAIYLIIVYDSFSYEDYPAYVMPDENIHERVMYYHRSSMQHVMEVYDLSVDREKQINEGRSFNIPPWPTAQRAADYEASGSID